jgi:hypothetical protein
MPLKNKEDQKEYVDQWYKDNLERKLAYARNAYDQGNERLRKIKRKPCHDCGNVFPAYTMQFDHNRDKLFNLSKAQTKKWELVLKEIEKCEIVCANCHSIRTHKRQCIQSPCEHE